jgi:hypothetical protein
MNKVALAIGLPLLMMAMSSMAAALTVEELLNLRKAGVSDETIRLFIQLELEKVRAQSLGPGRTMGQKTVVGPDGKKRVITYVIEDPEWIRGEQLESERLERRSWDMLRNLVIDKRQE